MCNSRANSHRPISRRFGRQIDAIAWWGYPLNRVTAGTEDSFSTGKRHSVQNLATPDKKATEPSCTTRGVRSPGDFRFPTPTRLGDDIGLGYSSSGDKCGGNRRLSGFVSVPCTIGRPTNSTRLGANASGRSDLPAGYHTL